MSTSRAIATGLAVTLAGCSSVPPPAPPPEPAPVITEPRPEPLPTAEEIAAIRAARLACESVTVAAVGDMMLGTDYPRDTLPDDDGISLLAGVAPVIDSADVAIGNLEGVLLDDGEPFKQCNNPEACYLFRSPARYAQRLADAGFDVMSLANNHARDFGEAGRTATMQALDAAGIRHSGRIGDVALWQEEEVRFAFIAFAPFANSWPMLDLDAAAAQVERLAADADIVIVSFHGGAEGAEATRLPFTNESYYGEDRGDVVAFSRRMVDAGGDLVIGHGPHVPRAMEIYQGRLIAYSLGNFATWYGISVSGPKGYAPILLAELDGNGVFTGGRIVSALQQRPAGPVIDSRQHAARMIRDLTAQDFGGDAIIFDDTGRIQPALPADQCDESQ